MDRQSYVRIVGRKGKVQGMSGDDIEGLGLRKAYMLELQS